MRNLKFRAWDKKRKVMFQNHTFRSIAETGIYDKSYDHLIWMQYTGLKDKNRKEIYEADIAKVYFRKWLLTGNYTEWHTIQNLGHDYIGVVIFKDFQWRVNSELTSFSPIFCDPDTRQFEVIGNIYENPELLKG